MKRNPSHRRRTGAVTILLTLVTMIAVVTAVAITTRNEVAVRRSQIDASHVARLESAIEAIAFSALETSLPVRLPVDPTLDHWIEVQAMEGSTTSDTTTTEPSFETTAFKATELRGGRIFRSIERRINKATK